MTDIEVDDFHYTGVEIEPGEIDLFFVVDRIPHFTTGHDWTYCDRRSIQINPVASGNYTLNYYLMIESFEDRGEWSTRLQDSKSIVIEKVADNEPPTGRVPIAGNPTEGQTLRFDPDGSIQDPDGLGPFQYQWYRKDQPILGATTDHYLLTNDDATQDISLRLSYQDGQGKTEHLWSLAVGMGLGIENVDDPMVGSSAISGSLLEGARLTLDTSGIADADGIQGLSYRWIRHYGVTEESKLEIGTDSNSYLLTREDIGYMISVIINDELESNSVGPIGPASDPLVEAPEDISVQATGNLTRVNIGEAQALNDQGQAVATHIGEIQSNGIVATDIPTNGQIELQPGLHLIKWSLNNEHQGGAQQIVRVDPIINFGQDSTASIEGPFECTLMLNGHVARYPVSIPYHVSGIRKTDLSEQTLYESELQLYGSEQQISVQLLDTLVGDVTEYESLLLSMDEPTNAVAGQKKSCHIALGNDNLPPRVSLTAFQDDQPIRIINRSGGSVQVTANIVDGDINDTHLYDWSETDQTLIDTDNHEESFTFNPTSNDPGLYRIHVTVQDNSGASHSTELSLSLIEESPDLDQEDSDGDGISDQDEGLGDEDGDGVADYLDLNELSVHQLAQQPEDGWKYILETELGLRMRLGDIAFYRGGLGAWISWNDIVEVSQDKVSVNTDLDGSLFDVGLYDFQVAGLEHDGNSIIVTIPQRQSISKTSVVRNLRPNGWDLFVVDDQNKIQSAQGSADGDCPPPDDTSYADGLQEGSWCISLTIEDGGPNDTDNKANGALAFTGGVSKASSEDDSSGSGGGGLVSIWLLLIVSGLMLKHKRHRRVIRP
jgi:hypothetical protein